MGGGVGGGVAELRAGGGAPISGAGGSYDGCGVGAGVEFSGGGNGGWTGDSRGGRFSCGGGGVYSGGGGEAKNVRLGKGQKKADWHVIGENCIIVGLFITVVVTLLLTIFTEAVWAPCIGQGAEELLCSFA